MKTLKQVTTEQVEQAIVETMAKLKVVRLKAITLLQGQIAAQIKACPATAYGEMERAHNETILQEMIDVKDVILTAQGIYR